ncbi:MAG: S-methyl-5'-thioinosine phosphorylase [Chloroflexi bacterium]|jgi:5'-methylthioadenosine phosphorylase|nr:S-methyl-5'-thioinosine phosphorylase [Chloroflexota bacterium]
MESAIITGTGIYQIPGFEFVEKTIETPYGQALINIGQQDGFELAFLARHGLDHTTPPHRINYRANLKALEILGVKRVLATNAVGSISRDIPPMGLALLTDFIDFTSGREFTFFDGGSSGLAHTNLDVPYCPALRQTMLALASQFGLNIHPKSVYVAVNGPRFESPAEIRMYAQLGGDVVGMTGIPEMVLARELGMHYAAVAYSINWAAGLEQEMTFVSDQMAEIRQQLALLLVKTLKTQPEETCACDQAVTMMQKPGQS